MTILTKYINVVENEIDDNKVFIYIILIIYIYFYIFDTINLL